MSELHAKQLSLEEQRAEYEKMAGVAARKGEELEQVKKDLQKRIESLTQEFMHQQSVMDEQMRRLQNEKHELKQELETLASQVRQQRAA